MSSKSLLFLDNLKLQTTARSYILHSPWERLEDLLSSSRAYRIVLRTTRQCATKVVISRYYASRIVCSFTSPILKTRYSQFEIASLIASKKLIFVTI